MASIEKRSGKYRVRYRDPSGRNRGRTFLRKADADRFAREVEVDMDRGDWIDPRKPTIALERVGRDVPGVGAVAGADDGQTYRRDLELYVLPPSAIAGSAR